MNDMRRTRSASTKQQNDQHQCDHTPAQGTQQRHLNHESISIATPTGSLNRGAPADRQVLLIGNSSALKPEAAANEPAGSEQVKPATIGVEDTTTKCKTKRFSWDALSRYYSERTNSFPDYGAANTTMLRPHISGSFEPVNTMSKRKDAGNPSISNESDDRAKKKPRVSPNSPSKVGARQQRRASLIVLQDDASTEVPRDVAKPATAFQPKSRIEVHLPSRNKHLDLTQTTKETPRRSAKPREHTRSRGKGHGVQQARPESVSSDSGEAPSREKPRSEVNVEDLDDLGDPIAADGGTQLGLVVSDIKRPGRKRLPSQPALGNAASATSRAKRKHQRSESPDELQRPQSRARNPVELDESDEDLDHHHSAKGTLKPSVFGSARTPPRKAATAGSAIEVRRAASGRNYYVATLPHTDSVYALSSSTSANLPRLEAVSASGAPLTNMQWMCLDASKVLQLDYCLGKNYWSIIIKRSTTNLQPAQLVIEFAPQDSVQPLKNFVDNLPETVKIRDLQPSSARGLMNHALTQAKSHVRPETATNHGTHSTTREGPAKRRASLVLLSPESKKPHRGQQPVKTSLHLDEPIDPIRLKTAANRPRRETRSSIRSFDTPSASNLILDVNGVKDEDRWTIMNPRWTEKWHQSLIYPPTGRNRTTVDADDIERLDEGEFLNDNLINFYLRYLQEQHKETLPRVYIFSTFFYEKLKVARPGKINYEGVKSWTTKIDLFNYDYVVIPVNENAHWYLAIISHPGELLVPDVSSSPSGLSTLRTRLSTVSLDEQPTLTAEEEGDDAQALGSLESLGTSPAPKYNGPLRCDPGKPHIITLDSLGNSHISTAKSLRLYLAEEARHKKGIELANRPGGFSAKCMPLAQATSIPQQPNWCDCGIFLLGYMKRFIRNPGKVAVDLLLKDKTVAQGWPEAFPELRNEVRGRILSLQEQQHALAQAAQDAKAKKRKVQKTTGVARQPPSISTKDEERSSGTTPRKENRYTRYRVSGVIEDDVHPEETASKTTSDEVASPTETFVSALTSPASEQAVGQPAASSASSNDVKVSAAIRGRESESPDLVDDDVVFIEPLATQSEGSPVGKAGSSPSNNVNSYEEGGASQEKGTMAASGPDQAPTESPYFTPKPADEESSSHGDSGAQYDGVEAQQSL